MSTEPRIDVLPTPNPNAKIFRCSQSFVAGGSHEFRREGSGEGSPLAQKLFSLDAVEQVLITTRFVTVTKVDSFVWDEVEPGVLTLLRSHLRSGEEAVLEQAPPPPVQRSPLEEEVEALFREEVRPALAMDGGDIQLVEVTEDGWVRARLIGSCASCPSSSATLYQGVQALLLETLPELQGLEQVP